MQMVEKLLRELCRVSRKDYSLLSLRRISTIRQGGTKEGAREKGKDGRKERMKEESRKEGKKEERQEELF